MAEDFTLRESIQLAVTTEQLGADYYERMAGRFKDEKAIAEIFNQLSKDEKVHEQQFKSILGDIPKEEDRPKRYELEQFLRATAISEFFQKGYFENLEGVNETRDALAKALAFEKATLQYYQAIADVLGEHKQLKAIIAAEKNHVITLVRIIPTDAVFRGLSDRF
jgi:rubrerythrin